MDDFFASVARAFALHRWAGPLFKLAVLALLCLTVALQLAGALRRWWAGRSLVRRLALERGLTDDDLLFLVHLAERASLAALTLFTHLDEFERATALALSSEPASAPGADDELALRVRRLRRALGYDRLPSHTPLLSTRELGPGIAIQIDSRDGQTFEVSERSFSVELRAPVALSPGQEVGLLLIYARDARYALRCRLLAVVPGPSGAARLLFAHDEAPERTLQREYLRVAAGGAVTLRPLSPGLLHPTLRKEVSGELVDVSGGGALIVTRGQPPVGLLMAASFSLAGRRFTDLRVVVISSARTADGRSRVHLEFNGISETEREPLVSSVNHLHAARCAAAQVEAASRAGS